MYFILLSNLTLAKPCLFFIAIFLGFGEAFPCSTYFYLGRGLKSPIPNEAPPLIKNDKTRNEEDSPNTMLQIFMDLASFMIEREITPIILDHTDCEGGVMELVWNAKISFHQRVICTLANFIRECTTCVFALMVIIHKHYKWIMTESSMKIFSLFLIQWTTLHLIRVCNN